jgi:hypothetical protein
MNLKTFLNSINYEKTALLDKDESAVRLYPAFVVNKCLSYFTDTIFHSNAMNCCPWVDKKQQFDFYRIGIRKKKRFSPWIKKETEDKVEVIKQAYGYTEAKAREVLNIIDSEQFKKIQKHLETGGNKNL